MKNCPHCGDTDLASDNKSLTDTVVKKHRAKKAPEVYEVNSSTMKTGKISDKGDHLSEGKILRNYRLTKMLGSGSYGEVWEAFTDLNNTFALKIIQIPEGTSPTELIADYQLLRNVHDYTNLIRYENPELITIHGHDYILMPMTDIMDGDLNNYKITIRNESFKTKERIVIEQILPQICNGLKVLHNAGIVHRDIKPGNILYRGTNFKLADFGASNILNLELFSTSTTSVEITGTLRYMPPEQISGKPCDARSDIYSVGITLCELLFDQTYPEDGPEVSSDLIDFLNRFIAPSPASRHQSIDEILEYNNKETNLKQHKPQPTRKNNSIIVALIITVGVLIFYLLPVVVLPSLINTINKLNSDLAMNLNVINDAAVNIQDTSAYSDTQRVINEKETESETTPIPPADIKSMSPKDVVKEYLEATAWEQRLNYVLHPERIKQEMAEYYSGASFPTDKSAFKEEWTNYKLITGHQLGGPVTSGKDIESVILIEKDVTKLDYYLMMDTDPTIYGSLARMLILKNTESGWRINWEARGIPDSPTAMEELKIQRPTSVYNAAKVFAFIKLGDSYSWQFQGRENDFYPFELYITGGEDFDTIQGYAPRDSAYGNLLYDTVRKSRWPVVPVTLKVAYITKAPAGEFSKNESYDVGLIDIVSFEHTYFY